MSILYDESLEKELDANGGEFVTHKDASFWQAPGKGIVTGLKGAAVSIERMGAHLGAAQQQYSAAQMEAAANLTPDKKTEQTLRAAAAPMFDTDEQLKEENLPQYPVFNPEEIGSFGIGLGKVVQSTPTIAAAVVNPVLGAAVGYAQGATEAHAEGYQMGLRGADLENYSAVGGASNAVGAALPGWGSFGRVGLAKYASRFVVGGLVNEAQEGVDRWGRASILDSAGFHEQANQMRHVDAGSLAATFVLGGIFNLAGGGHRDSRFKSEDVDAATGHAIHDNYTTETAPGIPATPQAEAAHVDAMNSAFESIKNGQPVDVSAHINESHPFVIPRNFAELQEHMRDVMLADGDFHAGMRELRDAVEAQGGEPLATVNQQTMPDGTRATGTAEATAQRVSEDAPAAAGLTEAPQVQGTPTAAAGAAEPDPIQIARSRADAIAEYSPEAAAEMHAELDGIEQAHALATHEADAYSVAAACAITHGV